MYLNHLLKFWIPTKNLNTIFQILNFDFGSWCQGLVESCIVTRHMIVFGCIHVSVWLCNISNKIKSGSSEILYVGRAWPRKKWLHSAKDLDYILDTKKNPRFSEMLLMELCTLFLKLHGLIPKHCYTYLFSGGIEKKLSLLSEDNVKLWSYHKLLCTGIKMVNVVY